MDTAMEKGVAKLKAHHRKMIQYHTKMAIIRGAKSQQSHRWFAKAHNQSAREHRHALKLLHAGHPRALQMSGYANRRSKALKNDEQSMAQKNKWFREEVSEFELVKELVMEGFDEHDDNDNDEQYYTREDVKSILKEIIKSQSNL